jgi:tRNA dimethylallyltransferase
MKLPPDLLTKCWFLTGPTAVGKTELSLQLAERLHAEILSLDSMAIYRGMDVGTAKPSAAEQERVPHHLIDLVDPWEEFTVADYLAAAVRCCERIVSRGGIPLFVGGTGFYLRSLLRGIFQGPPADEQVRRQLEARYDTEGADTLYTELARLDPAAAEKLHPNDKRRIVRALEVYQLTGRPFSSFHEEVPLAVGERPQHVYWLSPPRDWLHERINQRVDQMIADGLVDEVRALLALPQPLSKTARQAIGYKELFDAIESGGNLEEAIELIKTRSRQFARRQHTWFRNLEECRPVEITGTETPEELVEKLVEPR